MFHDVHPSGGILPLLWTLLKRPDLADLVRNFGNDRSTESPVGIEMFRTLFVPLAARFSLHDASGLLDSWMQKIWANVFERELWMLEFTLALLPKVTALFITVPARRGETEFVLGKLFMKSAAMRSVKRLYLSHHDYRKCRLDLGCVGDLLGMMPRLERLDPRSEQHDGSELEEADHVLSETGAFRVVQPEAILAQRKSTLKHVNAGFHEYLPFSRLGDNHREMRGYFSSFAKFEALEELLVRVSRFRYVDDFTYLLPESLTLLGLRHVPEQWDGVSKLALAVRNGRFRQLKTVVLDLGQEEFEMARLWLNLAGVTCVEYDNSHCAFGRDIALSLDYIARLLSRTSIPLPKTEETDEEDDEDTDEE
ncbi:hypothetical protein MKX08_006087 [Trichoderma sp. CBMAI-0020]|nr:hypothetical protein MKX08_006087 [Trichoderma sp. CBMAI-0020]